MFGKVELLKEKLKEIKMNDYSVPDNVKPYELAMEMMENIGSTDPELRDKLILSVICRWIMNGVLTGEQVIKIMEIALDEKHLFYKLGEMEDDSVFKRAFCVLVVGSAIYHHRSKNIIPEHRLREIKDMVVDYYKREKDLRGYVEHKGWADAVCHGADTLDEFAMCSSLGHDDLIGILDCIKEKVCVSNCIYINYEDERITTAAASVINRNILSDTEIIGWIRDFKNHILGKAPPHYYTQVSNIRNFLRSLYFRLLGDSNHRVVTDAILETLPYTK